MLYRCSQLCGELFETCLCKSGLTVYPGLVSEGLKTLHAVRETAGARKRAANLLAFLFILMKMWILKGI